MESNHGYTIGEEVYVKPTDWGVLKCKVVGFQVVGDKLPIVECKHPYKKGEKWKNAVDLDRISKTPVVKVLEWDIVEKTYEYKK
ncbi:hypothetical protein [Flavobacterium sp.]|jgi:hypothetical protein|uniref:hypothetical protein n=1 Tax=Flavobacterium sp. TaxID=239 RepID=UPI0037C061C5